MKRTLSLALMALAALLALAPVARAGAAKAQPAGVGKAASALATVTGAKVPEFGVYTSTVTSREKSSAVADGIKDRAKDFRLVRRSTLVVARLGTGIGFKYVLQGSPEGAAVNIEMAVRHPAIVNPETREPMTISRATFERVIGQGAHAVWSFDTPEDLVPGEYVIDISFEGKMLAHKAFRVTIGK